ncbi:MAG: GAF domain-containing protein [Candidatus Protistobacter heckmanni]|nr:GAF domain-containing protein [Candidatus Protistobacter heckmanni]
MGTDTLPSSQLLYLPLWAPMRVRGVLAVAPQVPRWLMVPDQRRQLETFATLVAIALERVHYVEVTQDALVKMESERLRNSLLSALTPGPGADGPANLALARELAQAMRENAGRIGQLMNNPLDMARLESGEVKLRKAWQPLEEVVGSALQLCGAALGR